MNRRPARRPSPTQSAAQQAVLNKIRSGGTIQGAQPNNPLAYAAQFFDPRRFFDSKMSSIPDLKGGMVGGREALIAPGGWNQDTAGLGEITVGGQRFFPAQSGKDLVYQRAPGKVGGQYGSIRVRDQLTPVTSASGPAERAYQQELSRTSQLTAQDPELQRYERDRKAAKTQEEMNAVRDMGLEMWQEKYGKTPMGRPGGAVGSFNPLMQKTFGYQTGMSPSDIAQTITNPSEVPVGPGEAPYQVGDLGTRAMSETGYDPAAYGLSPEMIKAYQEQLLKQAGAK
jgi:hypothetical protein